MHERGVAANNKIRVLHVDADESVTTQIERRLDADIAECEAVTETEPDSVIARLESSNFDCVVTGYELPGTNGLDILRKVRERQPDLPVIMFAADGNEAVASEAITAGVTDYVRRDVGTEGLDHLVERIDAVVDRGTSESDSDSRPQHDQTVFESFIGAFPDVVFVIDADGRYVDLLTSDSDSLLFDDPERLLGSRFQDLLPAETAERFSDAVQSALDTGEQQRLEYQLDVQSGLRWFEARIGPLTGWSDCETVYWIARDITERKRREQEFEQIFNGVQGGITINDIETGELVEANDSFCELLGYDRDEVLELGVDGVTATDEGFSAERAQEIITEINRTGETKQFEWAVETREGETRWLDIRGTIVEIGGQRRYVSLMRDITERRRREQEYEQIFNSVNDAIVIQDTETAEPIDANQTFLDRLGYDSVEQIRQEGLEGLSVTDAGYTQERARALSRRAIETGESETVEWQQETRAGDRRWIEATVVAATIRGKERLLSIQRDITERKRRERAIRALQTATDRFQTAETHDDVAEIAVEAASDALDMPMAVCWLADQETNRLDAVTATAQARNAGLVSDLGSDRYEYDVFLSGDVTEYRPTDRSPENPLEAGILLPLAEYGLLAVGKFDHTDTDDAVLDIARALADHATTALDRIDRADALKQSERRLRLIAERIDEVILLSSEDLSETLYVNPAYETVWGRPVEELYEDARAFVEAVDPRDKEELVADLEAMITDLDDGATKDSYSFEYRIRRPDGDLRWVSATGYAVELSDGTGRFIGVTEDITDRKRREQRLEVLNRVLRHNLRNQLDVIKSHAEVLARGPDGDNHAQRIIAAANELSEMGARARATDQIMSTDSEVTDVDASNTVREAVSSADTGTKVEVVTDIPESMTLRTNRSALHTAVESAVENAVEYADSAARVTLTDCSPGLELTIDDDGPGIPDSELVPIQTGTETDLRHGRGLGLWQLRWSVDKLGGELTFDTTDGTTIRLTVPDRSIEREGAGD